MSLSNKYRPDTFESVIGQPVIVEIVKKMCESGALSNRNFLFTGPAGTGKTTLGRLIAKSLNGTSDNIIEIDAASHSGVDDMREIVQQAQQFPIGTKYKIFLIDECHALSSNSWQAALKIIEEQAAMSVFIFCTTNPEKIPNTIISRVQTFNLSKISAENIYKRLKYVLDSEIKEGREISYEDDALKYLSRLANGGLRDALTMLDKTLAYGTNVTSNLLEKALELPNYDTYFNLLNSLARKDNASTTEIVDTTYNSGVNFIKWFEGFHSFLCNIVKYVLLRDINRTMIPSHYSDKLSNYTEQHVLVCLKLSNTVLSMIKDMKVTQYQLETCLTYLLSSKK
jgi:DNA polymerase-3 subunit gamma/tau